MTAAAKDDVNFARLLIDAGADKDAKTNVRVGRTLDSTSPLHAYVAVIDLRVVNFKRALLSCLRVRVAERIDSADVDRFAWSRGLRTAAD